MTDYNQFSIETSFLLNPHLCRHFLFDSLASEVRFCPVSIKYKWIHSSRLHSSWGKLQRLLYRNFAFLNYHLSRSVLLDTYVCKWCWAVSSIHQGYKWLSCLPEVYTLTYMRIQQCSTWHFQRPTVYPGLCTPWGEGVGRVPWHRATSACSGHILEQENPTHLCVRVICNVLN